MPLTIPVLVQQAQCPVVLLLDTSWSMNSPTSSGQIPIDELNKGLTVFKEALQQDDITARRVELAIVTFGPVQLQQEFVRIEEFIPPQLSANGMTPIGEAIDYALELAENRKAYYKQKNIPNYQPLFFLITDGEPDYGVEGDEDPVMPKVLAKNKAMEVAQRLKELDRDKKITFFSIGVQNANLDILQKITPPQRPHEDISRVMKLKELKFSELFMWITGTMGQIARSRPGQQVKFAPTSVWSQDN
jgi:uncharacterized protein YegL